MFLWIHFNYNLWELSQSHMQPISASFRPNRWTLSLRRILLPRYWISSGEIYSKPLNQSLCLIETQIITSFDIWRTGQQDKPNRIRNLWESLGSSFGRTRNETILIRGHRDTKDTRLRIFRMICKLEEFYEYGCLHFLAIVVFSANPLRRMRAFMRCIHVTLRRVAFWQTK